MSLTERAAETYSKLMVGFLANAEAATTHGNYSDANTALTLAANLMTVTNSLELDKPVEMVTATKVVRPIAGLED